MTVTIPTMRSTSSGKNTARIGKAGSGDVIKSDHTVHIYETVPNAHLKIFDGASHSGYIMNSTKIAKYILSVI